MARPAANAKAVVKSVLDELGDKGLTRRFWSRVVKTASCWIWSGPTDSGGRGMHRERNFAQGAHRMVYMAFTGPIPEAHVIRAACGEPLCVNPEHLQTATRGAVVRETWRTRPRKSVPPKRRKPTNMGPTQRRNLRFREDMLISRIMKDPYGQPWHNLWKRP